VFKVLVAQIASMHRCLKKNGNNLHPLALT